MATAAVRTLPDAIDTRMTPGAFFASQYDRFGKPDWLLAGTSFTGGSAIPALISVRDYLIMVGNLAANHPDPAYHIAYLADGVPLYYGALGLGLTCAPNLYEALKLLPAFADSRPGYHRHVLRENADKVTLELQPMTELGKARPIVVETPLLFLAHLVAGYTGNVAADMVVELVHPAPGHADRLVEALGCEVRFDARCDAITIPAAVCKMPNIAHDPLLWEVATRRCAVDARGRSPGTSIDRIRSAMVLHLARTGRFPRLQDIADALATSERTLIRYLRADGHTFRDLLDEQRLTEARKLLADPKTSLASIAQTLGFSDASSFSRSFKRWTGQTPLQHREDQTGEFASNAR